MENIIEAVVKLLAVIVPICGGLLWIIKQNRRPRMRLAGVGR